MAKKDFQGFKDTPFMAARKQIHRRVTTASTIGEMWRLYYEVRFQAQELPPEGVALMREVFYGGIAAMFELVTRVSNDSVSEDAGVEYLNKLEEELEIYARQKQ